MTGRNITIRESDLLTLLLKLKATGLDHVHDIETQKIESTFVTSAFLGGVDFPARGYSPVTGNSRYLRFIRRKGKVLPFTNV